MLIREYTVHGESLEELGWPVFPESALRRCQPSVFVEDDAASEK